MTSQVKLFKINLKQQLCFVKNDNFKEFVSLTATKLAVYLLSGALYDKI